MCKACESVKLPSRLDYKRWLDLGRNMYCLIYLLNTRFEWMTTLASIWRELVKGQVFSDTTTTLVILLLAHYYKYYYSIMKMMVLMMYQKWKWGVDLWDVYLPNNEINSVELCLKSEMCAQCLIWARIINSCRQLRHNRRQVNSKFKYKLKKNHIASAGSILTF